MRIALSVARPGRNPETWKALGATVAGVIVWFAIYRQLQPFADWVVSHMPIDRKSPLGSAVAFFIYDTPKVLMLLALVVFGMGVVRSYFSPDPMVAGIAAGALIHGYVPADVMARVMGANTWWSVPAAVLIGVPMYSNAAGIIPVVEALLGRGAALGTTLAFMMSVIALSLPEMIILRKVLSLKLLAVFIGVVTTGILAIGFLFNALFQ